MIAKRVPGQLRHYTMILVQVVAVVRKNQIRGDLLLQVFEKFFYLGANIRKKTVFEVADHDFRRCRFLKKEIRASTRLNCSLRIRADDEPVNATPIMAFEQLQNGPAATDLDVVAMRAQTQN